MFKNKTKIKKTLKMMNMKTMLVFDSLCKLKIKKIMA